MDIDQYSKEQLEELILQSGTFRKAQETLGVSRYKLESRIKLHGITITGKDLVDRRHEERLALHKESGSTTTRRCAKCGEERNVTADFTDRRLTCRRCFSKENAEYSKRLRKASLDHPFLDQDVFRDITIHGGNGLVVSDVHLPLTDYSIANAGVDLAVKLGATDWCVLAGDTWNMDYLQFYGEQQKDASAAFEIPSANQLVRDLLEIFKRVIVLRGNHDDRFIRQLGHKMNFVQSLRILLHELSDEELSRVEFTARDRCIIETDLDPYLVCHTRQYSAAQLSIPAKIADIERINVIAGHRHHHAMGWSPSGYRVIESGGWFDTGRTQYLKSFTTTHPVWQNGDTILINGQPVCRLLSCPPIL